MSKSTMSKRPRSSNKHRPNESKRRKLEVDDILVQMNKDLIDASRGGHVEVVKSLIEAGADVRAHGHVALTWSIQHGHVEVVKLLLEAGADVHAVNHRALRRARQEGHDEVIQLCFDFGTDDPAQCDERAWVLACKFGPVDTVKVLLRATVDPIHRT